jgi:hypothetical protein
MVNRSLTEWRKDYNKKMMGEFGSPPIKLSNLFPYKHVAVEGKRIMSSFTRANPWKEY